ncbi:hypothetical protein [Kushneria phosphatilytica]|uniref:Uncharacterized protein n=1 Tax=Kushneria phosphatilytica TaxID=657387 RepID=A0A1S1NVV8_9GAMM|nr:hypothetical protein [Kushneria phosphatilytica]OHV11250.1 hypothetical protein BH688_08010 [Kushneria phosphatilytica]QEL12175.1 hypothetical protein FY550_14210 [Kushneria phosphatilytica]
MPLPESLHSPAPTDIGVSRDDNILLHRCAMGDTTAFRQLRDVELPLMLAVSRAFMTTPSHCDQVVHDALVLGWKNARRFSSEGGHARHWLWRIFCSRLANQLRALEAWPLAEDAENAVDHIARALQPRLTRSSPADPTSELPALAAALPVAAPSDALLKRIDTTIGYLPPNSGTEGMPAGETIFGSLYHPALRWPIARARLQYRFREGFKHLIGRPLEDAWFERWCKGWKGARLEALGLPRRSVEERLDARLDLSLSPQDLLCSVSFPDRAERRRLANQFIWQGNWDHRLSDVRTGKAYRFIADIWQHRLDLAQSDAYQHYMERLHQGRPWRSHHKGVSLDTPERILRWLRIYHLYLEDMACFGFDAGLGKDRLGVAIDRHGQIVKINKGLHRLAMAQVLGISTLPVRVRGVHRQWWVDQVGHHQGDAALDAMARALPTCRPAPLSAIREWQR